MGRHVDADAERGPVELGAQSIERCQQLVDVFVLSSARDHGASRWVGARTACSRGSRRRGRWFRSMWSTGQTTRERLLLSRGSDDHEGGEARRREPDRERLGDVHKLGRRLDRVVTHHASEVATSEDRISRRPEAGETLAGVEPWHDRRCTIRSTQWASSPIAGMSRTEHRGGSRGHRSSRASFAGPPHHRSDAEARQPTSRSG
jgi:hypothetical protein